MSSTEPSYRIYSVTAAPKSGKIYRKVAKLREVETKGKEKKKKPTERQQFTSKNIIMIEEKSATEQQRK